MQVMQVMQCYKYRLQIRVSHTSTNVSVLSLINYLKIRQQNLLQVMQVMHWLQHYRYGRSSLLTQLLQVMQPVHLLQNLLAKSSSIFDLRFACPITMLQSRASTRHTFYDIMPKTGSCSSQGFQIV